MSKPEDISQAAWEAAIIAAQDWSILWSARSEYEGDAEQDLTESFARAILAAILAEREACAVLVEGMLRFADTTSRADVEIAAAIRKRAQP